MSRNTPSSSSEYPTDFVEDFKSLFNTTPDYTSNTLADRPEMNEAVFAQLILHGTRADWEYYWNRGDYTQKLPFHHDIFEELVMHCINPDFAPTQTSQEYESIVDFLRTRFSASSHESPELPTQIQQRISILLP